MDESTEREVSNDDNVSLIMSKSSHEGDSNEYQETLGVSESVEKSVASENPEPQKPASVEVPVEKKKFSSADECYVVNFPQRATSRSRYDEDSRASTYDDDDECDDGSSRLHQMNQGIDCSEIFISLCNSYQNLVIRLNLTKYMIPVYFVLLLIPASAAVIGALGMKSCPMSPSTPVMLFMIGIAGILGFTSKIVETFLECITGRRFTMCTFTTSSFCYITVLLLHSAEMLVFLGAEPDDDVTSDTYCDPTFYWFTFYINWIGLGVILIFAVIYIPSLCRAEGQPIISDSPPRYGRSR